MPELKNKVKWGVVFAFAYILASVMYTSVVIIMRLIKAILI